MDNVFNYILQEFDDMNSCYRPFKNELRFDMDGYFIVFQLNENTFETEYDEDFIAIDDVKLSEIKTESINKVLIQCGTPIYDDDDETNTDDSPYKEIIDELLKNVNEKFVDSIKCTTIGDYCIDDSYTMCGEVWENGFEAEVSDCYNDNIDFFKFLDHNLKQLLANE